MPERTHSLDEKFALDEPRQILSGTQAIVRLALMQKRRDELAGLNTAGYVTGYRGSPIASLETAFERARALCALNHIRFQPGLNEDLAATAIWGSQQAELWGEGKYDGVFAIWYGKGPGVDRTGDVFRHANHAGTSRHGGVLALMGDDHTCESSTSAHQSEFAMVDFMVPVLNPAGVQELLDYGVLGFALSRYAGVWVGLKCVKDNIESTATVDGRIDRIEVKLPDETEFRMPEGGLNIRRGDTPLAKEARLHNFKRGAMLAFARANRLDRVVLSGGPDARLGIITTGKSYLDTRQALDELGLDELAANRLGIRLYKVAMTWPLEPHGIRRFCDGLDLVLVIEEKRSLIETQVKEQLFDYDVRPRVLGKRDENGGWLFPANGALDPTGIAIAIGERLLRMGRGGDALKDRLAELKRIEANRPTGVDAFPRVPYFCAGCPHNSSTVLPEGARAYAGIGCHYMVQWMDRATEGFTQMGGEGANWIGEAPFSRRTHVFQNLGDGTYIHSGSLAIRAAHAAGTNITFKILYNDAVAMTGGQKLDGGLTVPQLAAQLLAEGVKRLVVVTDEPAKYRWRRKLPRGVPVYHRRDLQAVQLELSKTPGVTALIYDQTCAAEKRRRRKRGLYPDPDRRVFINDAVCEGCGDCGIKSNCVAVIPHETEFGRKRAIDQSACNKDFSCLEGFCPSFVTLHGAKVRKVKVADLSGVAAMLGALPAPRLPPLDRPYAMLVNGVGGTGVVTLSAILGQAAHIERKGFGAIDMTGLAQKGGSVACHMRFARSPPDIHAIRVGAGSADCILGGDLVVTASNKVLETVRPGATAIVYSTHEMTTGDFARLPNLEVPGEALRARIAERVRGGPLHAIDAHGYAVRLFGDSIAANMFLLGYAYQLGHVPVGHIAIEEAIELNGAAVTMNREAFRFGRLAAHDRAALDRVAGPKTAPSSFKTLDEMVDHRARHLAAYQDARLAERYRARVRAIAQLEAARTPGATGLAWAVAGAYHKLLAYKDEYEVARLFTDGSFAGRVESQFEGVRRMQFHLAPPFLSRFYKDKLTGAPRKIAVGGWILPIFRLLARGKALRGTRWDVFGYSAERRLERQMIADYERLLDEIERRLSPATHRVAVALARLPEDVKGFGHVKQASWTKAKKRESFLLAELRKPAPVKVAAE
ncbi:MAG TPA: indolepyruvate ferredoxin oxidoreductase family protein [Hyphomicrobiaceae bacterium]|nr:indolepyruvate ferredoxin oxidoreductase family protein [Hyphomicrobiaceae bacterium]